MSPGQRGSILDALDALREAIEEGGAEDEAESIASWEASPTGKRFTKALESLVAKTNSLQTVVDGTQMVVSRSAETCDRWSASAVGNNQRAVALADALSTRNKDLVGVTERFAALCDRLEDALFKGQKKGKKS